MSLHHQLIQRQQEGRPIRVGLIGAGKFGSMYLSQVPRTPGVHVLGIADLSPQRARDNLKAVGWNEALTQARSLDEAFKNQTTHISEDWKALVEHPALDVLIECTGSPPHAVEHILHA
jgi:predicted homoserine dehydrogenase-like protein